ncbi:MAG: hypothetical protein VX278_22945 [Myxococcota bacterium]|nr:hypothetical protein [Myxococcota bacterium]
MLKSSTSYRVNAPGKLVIAGEYAVLDGAPALVLAIDRGVSCHVMSGAGIETPTGDTRFVAPAIGERAETKRFVFRDWNPVLGLGDQKPGFGGSAAACVAACIASGRDGKDAFEIHRRVQGSGSGIDVAASLYGGMIRFQSGSISMETPCYPVVIWSGRSAKTGPRVQHYLHWHTRSSFVERSTALVNSFSQDPVSVIQELYSLLRHMAKQADIQYETATLNRIADIASSHGGAAKPSGAGGGDCAIAFFPTTAQKEDFVLESEHEGFSIIPVQPAPGAKLEYL